MRTLRVLTSTIAAEFHTTKNRYSVNHKSYRQVLIGQWKNFTCMYFTYDAGLRVQYPNGILHFFHFAPPPLTFCHLCHITRGLDSGAVQLTKDRHLPGLSGPTSTFLSLSGSTNTNVWNWALPGWRELRTLIILLTGCWWLIVYTWKHYLHVYLGWSFWGHCGCMIRLRHNWFCVMGQLKCFCLKRGISMK